MYSSFDKFAGVPSELQQEMNQEMGVFSHSTDANRFLPLTTCAQYIPGVGNHGVTNGQGVQRGDIDTESNLRQQNTIASKRPDFSLTPWKQECNTCKNCNFGLPCNCRHCGTNDPHGRNAAGARSAFGAMNQGIGPVDSNVPSECPNPLEPEYTRLDTIKPCNLPGVHINRFEALCESPQNPDRIHGNQYIGVGTRNYITDKFDTLFGKKCSNKY